MEHANSDHIHCEDAKNYIVRTLKNPPQIEGENNRGNFDVFLPTTLKWYLAENGYHPPTTHTREPLLRPFYEGAWELCRQGILRPGFHYEDGVIKTDSPGKGYFLTMYGREWLKKTQITDLVPTDPDRFSRLFQPFQKRFGQAFIERVQEAGRCYHAQAYYGCCAMCGAAAETIILSLAVAKQRDENKVYKTYFSSRGRSRIIRLLLQNQPPWIQNEFRRYSTSLSYWRDEAAHGAAQGLTESEADAARHQILRLVQFTDQRWDDLTA